MLGFQITTTRQLAEKTLSVSKEYKRFVWHLFKTLEDVYYLEIQILKQVM